MYSYFKGNVEEKFNENVIIDVNSIGYEVYLPLDELNNINIGDNVKIYTYLEHREDSMKLYGFINKNKLAFFKKLIKVSGIGSRVALAIISNISTEDMCNAIVTENVLVLKSIPGIGPKMAAKIIFELKDKISKDESVPRGVKENKNIKEAKIALKVLGYTDQVISSCLDKENLDSLSVQDIIKLCLKKLQK